MRSELPAGTVTFLFTDIEGSTRLLHALGPERYAEALAEHRRVLRDAFHAHGGVEVDTQGDSFFVAFPTAAGAVEAARMGQKALASGSVKVRMGLHTGTAMPTPEGYVGIDVHRGARVAALAHGGQVLLSSTAAALVEGQPLLDLGHHRLKDFDGPAHLFQLGTTAFPLLRTPGAVELPTPATPFLGREHELYDAIARWYELEPRVLTIVGPGGVGKTRFAIELARLLAEDAPGATVFVPLAAVQNPNVVVPLLADRLGASEPTAAGVAARVAGRPTHVLLDNLEQLLPDVASALAAVLGAASELRLIGTSREPLRITGEVELDLEPLSAGEAALLFVERARAVGSMLERSRVVDDLCTRLDRLPLAIELAASRTKLLTVDQVLDRVGDALDLLRGPRDADRRHGTLRATIGWSYELLDARDQEAFRSLAVFRSGWSVDAAERVCEVDLDALGSLLDKSLVRRREEVDGGPRFWMLEMIREFGIELLDDSGDRDRLEPLKLAYLQTIADDAQTTGEHGFGGEWSLDLVATEIDEIRASLDWAAEHDPVAGLRLAAALEGYWVVRAAPEGGAWLGRLLDAATDAPPALRAAAFRARGGAVEIAGQFLEVEPFYRESLRLYELEGDELGVRELEFRLIANRINRRVAAGAEDDLAGVVEELDSLRRHFVEVGDAKGELQCLSFLGTIASASGDWPAAVDFERRSVEVCRRIGFRWWECLGLGHLADYLRHAGDHAGARQAARESLAVALGLGERMGAVYAAAELAAATVADGDLEHAGVLWGAVEAEEEVGQINQWPSERAQYEALIVPAQPDDAFERGRARGRQLALGEAAALADPTGGQTEP